MMIHRGWRMERKTWGFEAQKGNHKLTSSTARTLQLEIDRAENHRQSQDRIDEIKREGLLDE